MVHRGVKKHNRMSSSPQEIQKKPLIRKPKQIQTTKSKNLTYHQRSQKILLENLLFKNKLQSQSKKNWDFNQFNSIRIKEEKIIKFTSDNAESYNQPFTLTKLQNLISKSNNSAI